jgi:hypothetical protein
MSITEKQHAALRFIAASPRGVSLSTMMARGFSFEMLQGLVYAGWRPRSETSSMLVRKGSHICGSPAPGGLQLSNEKTAFREDLTTTGRSGLARPSVYAGSSCSRNTADIDRALLVMIIFV